MVVSPPTRALVARLPTGETRLGGPRLRAAYDLEHLSRSDRGRIADELRRAGLEVASDSYGLVVRKGRGLDPHTVRLRSVDLPRASRGSTVVLDVGRQPPRRPTRRGRGRLRAVAAVATVSAAAAAAVAGVPTGGGAVRDAAGTRARPADVTLERTRAARRLGVRALRTARAGRLDEARALVSRSLQTVAPPVVETQRAARVIVRLGRGQPPGGAAG